MTHPLHQRTRDRAQELLAGGFDSPETIRAQLIEELNDEQDIIDTDIEPLVDAALAEAQAARALEQRSWPPITDCDRLDAAFEDLNAAGIMARHNWTCCGTCGPAEMPDEYQRLDGQWQGVPIIGYTFYHMQDVESAVDGRGIYLGYGSTERAETAAAYTQQCLRIARTVQETLTRHGLHVTWDGSYSMRIGIPLDWKRRNAPPRFCGDNASPTDTRC